MKTVHLAINRKAPEKSVPMNQYSLEIGFEHGDADHNTDSIHYFNLDNPQEMEILKQSIALLSEMQADYEPMDGRRDVENRLKQYVPKDSDYSAAISWLVNNWEYDLTMHDSGYMARCDCYGVTFHDVQGVEYDVDVTIENTPTV